MSRLATVTMIRRKGTPFRAIGKDHTDAAVSGVGEGGAGAFDDLGVDSSGGDVPVWADELWQGGGMGAVETHFEDARSAWPR
ncbi:hypothetical protein GCM10023334_075970 [Nonomuraea thailandensis]